MPKKSTKLEQARNRKEELCELFNKGMSICKIKDITGINRTYIAIVLEECGIYKKETKKEIEDKIITKYKENEKYIIDQYNKGVSVKKIRKKLQDKGILLDTKRIVGLLKNNNIVIKDARFYNKKFVCDESAFEDYNKESCYWAGLLAADGCVYQRKDSNSKYVILCLCDKELADGFADYIKYTGGVTKLQKKVKDKNTTVWEVRCCSNKLCEDLEMNFNITPGKTLTYTPPDSIPEDLINFFILGYIDGDGSITYSTTTTGRKQFALNITGTFETIDFIKEYFNLSHLKTFQRFPERRNNNTTLCVQGNDQLNSILTKLYSDDFINEICLQRKYQRYLILKEQQEKKKASA